MVAWDWLCGYRVGGTDFQRTILRKVFIGEDDSYEVTKNTILFAARAVLLLLIRLPVLALEVL